jgi:hypothetical protein
MLQNIALLVRSMPVSPNSASGRRKPSPNGPSCRNDAGSQPPSAKFGSSRQ